MKKINYLLSIFAVAALTAAIAPYAAAGPIVLNFAGLNGGTSGNREAVLNYYDGGFGSQGSGPGPNYGIVFGSDAIVCSGAPTAGSCNTAMIPGGSGARALFFLSGPGDMMNVAGGFTTGFSFYYTAPFNTGTVNVYSGLNGAGTLLASLSLPLTTDGASTSGCYSTNYCPYSTFGVNFSGTAESVNFTGVANQIGFADITLGSSTAGGGGSSVSEPSTWALFGAGLLALGLALSARRRSLRTR